MQLTKGKFCYFSVCLLTMYFCTKMLWDKYSFDLTEYLSFLLILIGLSFFIKKIERDLLPSVLVFLAFSIYILMNGLILTDITHLIRGVYEYIFYGLIFFSLLGYFFYLSEQQINKVMLGLGYVGIVLAVLTFIEFIRGKAFLEGTGTYAYGTIISGNFVFRAKVFTRSYLSHGMIMAILAIDALYLKKITGKAIWNVTFVMCMTAILCTSSRGPLMAGGIGSLLFAINMKDLKKINFKVFIKIVLIVVLLIAVSYLILFSDVTVGNETIMYFLTRIRKAFDWSHDAGNVGRLQRWSKYFNYYLSHNIFMGCGVSNTGSSGVTTIMGTTESGVLKRIIELGIVGTVLYYGWLGKTISVSLKKYPVEKENLVLLRKLAFAEVLSILVDDCILQVTEEIMITFYLYFFVALLYFTHYLLKQDNLERVQSG